MEEMHPCYIESIYLFKRLHDRGKSEELLKMYQNIEIDGDMYYEIAYEAIGSVFADTNTSIIKKRSLKRGFSWTRYWRNSAGSAGNTSVSTH